MIRQILVVQVNVVILISEEFLICFVKINEDVTISLEKRIAQCHRLRRIQKVKSTFMFFFEKLEKNY